MRTFGFAMSVAVVVLVDCAGAREQFVFDEAPNAAPVDASAPAEDASSVMRADGGLPLDGGSDVMAKPVEYAFSQVYFASCQPDFETKPLSFWATIRFVSDSPNVTKQPDNLSFGLEALALQHASPPSTVSRSGITGNPLPFVEGFLLSDYTFNATAPGQVVVPQAAASSHSQDVVFSHFGLRGKFDPRAADFCAHFFGHVVQPQDAALEEGRVDRNVCLLTKTFEGQSAPTYTPFDYTCPVL